MSACRALCALLLTSVGGCAVAPRADGPEPAGRHPGGHLLRRGQEIMVAGQLFDVGAPVVLWTDPGGYDAYRVEKRFVPWDEAGWSEGGSPASPNRYGVRFAGALDDAQLERVRGGGWTLDELGDRVDQFVIHYDAAGTSRQCFKILHDMRGLSVHFMLDLDGTIYQTLDLKERAWHATKSNDRSIGIEIANIGAYPAARADEVLGTWYAPDADGGAHVTLPAWMGDGGVRAAGFIARPARPGPIVGEVHGSQYAMHDLTDAQYDSLIKLTATLCEVFPRLRCDAPRGADGEVLTRTLTDAEWEQYSGLLGHLHVQENKIDPGPAFDWARVIEGARRESER